MLTAAELPTPLMPWAEPLTEQRMEEALRAGVRAFLWGYAIAPATVAEPLSDPVRGIVAEPTSGEAARAD